MKLVCLVFCFAIAASAGAQERTVPRVDREQQRRNLDFTWSVKDRARQVAPVRRDAPLREINLTDDEVREIQAATRSYLPSSYLNISPVVTGCPCEDGAGCTDQVYVLADAGTESKGLQLSRIRNEWTVGDLQKWWLNYARLLEKRDSMEYSEFADAEFRLAREFPVCSPSVIRAAESVAAQTKETKK